MMITLIFLVFNLIIYSYYGYVWAKIAGKDKAKVIFGITGFLITLATHWLLSFVFRYGLGYFVDYYYSTEFISRYFLQIVTVLTLIILILTSELYTFLLRRRFGRMKNEVENIGHHE